MEYYIGEGSQQRGPFTLDQLQGMRLRPETLVWHQGMTQWQPARTIPELHAPTPGPSVGTTASLGTVAPPPVATPIGYGNKSANVRQLVA